MPSTLLVLLLAAPANCVVRDGRDPGSIPKLEVPEPPTWEDIEHPEFEPYPIEEGLELLDNAVLEQFAGSDDDIFARWKVSAAERIPGEQYAGEWALAEPETFKGFNNDRGLVLVSENTVGAIARKFDAPIDTTSGEKPFVLQYEVKNQVRLRCGGGYIKVLPPTPEADYSSFSGETPYLVMFGPDKCGETDKVHVILHRNGVEHHLVQPPRTVPGLISVLYTLVIHPNLDFEVRVNGAILRSGNLLDKLEFDPPLVPAREIADENDAKPSDWDDREYVPSPDETEKPEDWDESEPRLISDPEAVKPAKWREDIPIFIVDPEATKPEGWDDAEDGEWVPPQILNPECQGLDEEAGEGCGEWTAPLVKNPKYKGVWTRPLVPNPSYQGVWTPRRIPNPDFDEARIAEDLAKMDADVGGVGFELLTVQGLTLFDNIYVGNSVRDAENIGNATWTPKFMLEEELFNRALQAHEKQAQDGNTKVQEKLEKLEKRNAYSLDAIVDAYSSELRLLSIAPYRHIVDNYNDFRDLLISDRLAAFTTYPVTAALVMIALTVLTSVLFGIASVVKLFVVGSPIKNSKPEAKTDKAEKAEKSTAENPVEQPVVEVVEDPSKKPQAN